MLGVPNPVTKSEVETFLENKLNMQLAAVDEEGYPNIQPVWFYYDRDSKKFYTGTLQSSKKIHTFAGILTEFIFRSKKIFLTKESRVEHL